MRTLLYKQTMYEWDIITLYVCTKKLKEDIFNFHISSLHYMSDYTTYFYTTEFFLYFQAPLKFMFKPKYLSESREYPH